MKFTEEELQEELEQEQASGEVKKQIEDEYAELEF